MICSDSVVQSPFCDAEKFDNWVKEERIKQKVRLEREALGTI